MADVTGTAANDVLVGTNDDDTLNGLLGADKMAGGNGNDTYFVDQAGTSSPSSRTRACTTDRQLGLHKARRKRRKPRAGRQCAQRHRKHAGQHDPLGNSLDNTIDGDAGHDFVAGGMAETTP